MKSFILFFIVACSGLHAAVISLHDFRDITNDPDTLDLQNHSAAVTGISSVSDLTLGSGFSLAPDTGDRVHTSNGSPPGDAVGNVSFSTATIKGGGASDFIMLASGSTTSVNNEATVVTNQSYVGFTFDISSGYEVDLTSFFVRIGTNNSNTSLPKISMVHINGVKVDSTLTAVIDNKQSFTHSFNLSGAPTLSAGTVDVKYYIWAPGTTSSSRNVQYDDLTLNGTVAVIPEPSSLILVGFACGFLGCLRRRKR